MQELTKKPHTNDDIVTLTLRVHRDNVSKIKEYIQAIDVSEERIYTIDEVFPEYVGSDQQVALRAYRTREGVTQKQLAQMTGIPVYHISEIENGKRYIKKELVLKFAKALNISDYQFLES